MKKHTCPECEQETLTYSINGDTTLVEQYICSECGFETDSIEDKEEE